MPHTTARLCIVLALFMSLSACSIGQHEQAAVITAQPANVSLSNPTAPIVPTATTVPTALPTSEPTSIPLPTALPTPTADPWAQYEPYTIEALRKRAYGTEGQIEIVRTIEELPNFTRYLIAYPSDGLRITGMLDRPALPHLPCYGSLRKCAVSCHV
jgi:hypothetical protein